MRCFSQMWLHVQTLVWTTMATGNLLHAGRVLHGGGLLHRQELLHTREPLHAQELLHVQAGTGRAGSSGRAVPVSGGGVGPSPAGWLAEAVTAQTLSPRPAPLPIGLLPFSLHPSLLYGL